MDNIIITVSGRAGIGKSRVIYLLKEYMKLHGFNTQISTNDYGVDEHRFDHYMEQEIMEALDSIKYRNTRIIFQEENNQRTITSRSSYNYRGNKKYF